MIYGSVCSGIEAATVAWHGLGWKPAWFSEIEKFPSQVLAHHYPGVPNHGDMTKFNEWGIKSGSVDLLVGGTPCQSFSVAGLRKGLDDPRGSLMLTYLALVERARPRWVVWENVPGVLSSNGGRDFGAFLGALGQLGYGWAYRVLDAQYFGVAQRRRRVFVVGCLGSGTGAGQVLFEPESVRRNSPSPEQKIPDEGEPSWWDGKSVSQTLDAVLYKGQMMPEKNRFPVVALGKRSSLLANATKMETARYATLIMPSATVQAQLKRMNLSTRKGTATCGLDALRRLTTTECERLQGFPGGYTDIRPGGKSTPDGPRLKAIGNSMAVPVMRWIGQRIDEVDKNARANG